MLYWRPEEPDAEAEASAPGRDTTEDTVDDARGAAGDTRPPNADESDAIGEADLPDRLFKEIKRHTDCFATHSRHATADSAETWLQTLAFISDQLI